MDGQPLPQWQSHKKVWGDKIVEMVSREMTQSDASPCIWKLAGGGLVHVSKELLARVPAGIAAIGGYYVVYEDGFKSWSPAKAFEEGYTRIEEVT